MPRPCRDQVAQRAALALLAQGYSPGELALVTGMSRQLVNQWAKSAGIDWRRIRNARLIDAWHRALAGRGGKGGRKGGRKAALRRIATEAKAAWDKQHGTDS